MILVLSKDDHAKKLCATAFSTEIILNLSRNRFNEARTKFIVIRHLKETKNKDNVLFYMS